MKEFDNWFVLGDKSEYVSIGVESRILAFSEKSAFLES